MKSTQIIDHQHAIEQEYPSVGYGNLRVVFAIGLLLEIILFFVPGNQSRLGVHSSFSACQLIMQNSAYFVPTAPLFAMFYIADFCLSIVILIMAFVYPKRIVFVLAASWTLFVFVTGLMIGTSPTTVVFLIPRLLYYLSIAMVSTGFWIRPKS
jgi:hypothetical protein